MRKILILSFTVSIFAIVFTPINCFSESRVQTPIGVIIPLSGPLASYGEAILNGLQLAREERAQIDKGCTIRVDDSKYDTKTSITIFSQMTEQEHRPLIYVFGGPMTDAMAPLTERVGAVLLTSENDSRYSIGRENVIRINSPAEDSQRLVVEHIKKHGWKRVAFVTTENQYIYGLVTAFRKVSPKSFEIDHIAAFQPSDSDLRSAVTKLRAKNFDIIGVYLLPGQLGQFYQLLAAQKISTPTFAGDFFEDINEQKSAGRSAAGAVYAISSLNDLFRDSYRKRFPDSNYVSWGAMGYEFGAMISQQICSSQQPLDRASILAALKSYSRKGGAFGDFTFVSSPEGDKYFNIRQELRTVPAQ